MGALIVDFALTIAISVAAASSAVISYVPALAAWRLPLALGLCALVAAMTWFGHLGRLVFAAFTLVFLAAARGRPHGWIAPVAVHAAPAGHGSGHSALAAVVLAFPSRWRSRPALRRRSPRSRSSASSAIATAGASAAERWR